MQKKAQARLGSIFLVLSMLLNLLPITAIASPLGGTVERVQAVSYTHLTLPTKA